MPDDAITPEEVEGEPQVEPTPEELIVETPQFLHDILLYAACISAGLLCRAGAISVDEARAMAGLKPFSEEQRARILQLLRWSRDTGVIVPIAWHDLWCEKGTR